MLNFLEVTGIIGGLFELFEVVFGIIIGIVSSYSLRHQLIEEIKINKKKNRSLEKELNGLRKEWLDFKKENQSDNTSNIYNSIDLTLTLNISKFYNCNSLLS